MKFTRIVLKPQAKWSDVHSAAYDARDWRVTEVSPVKQDEPYVKRWKTVDERCVIVYVQDPLREVRCYHLSGATRKSNATYIRRLVPTYDQAEIEALMASARSPAQKVAAVYTAAASVPTERDPAIFDCLTRSLSDPDPAVRRAAVDATLLALWPDLREPLEQVAAADADAGLRAFAGETLQTLQSRAWSAAPGAFDFVPLPPDPRRITPLTGVRDDWYEAAHGERPAPPPVPPAPSRKPAFRLPDWLARLMRNGDWDGFHWLTPEQIRAAASQATEFTLPPLMTISERGLTRSRSLWESMVPVADGPEFTARGGQPSRSRLFVNRDDPEGLLLALAGDHPPIYWVPAGRTRASVDALAAAYFFPGIPPQSDLPFQTRLFLSTQSMIGGFDEVERCVERSPFTDFLPWGSRHPTDPYPERIAIAQISLGETRRYAAQDPRGLPRTSIRTRYSRSIIQLIDWRNGYFADLYFRPIPPEEWAESRNDEFGTDFPPGTPVDVAGALSGLECLGPERLRPQADEATDPYQRRACNEIIGFLEQAPSLD
jgi:hypothetical protein